MCKGALQRSVKGVLSEQQGRFSEGFVRALAGFYDMRGFMGLCGFSFEEFKLRRICSK